MLFMGKEFLIFPGKITIEFKIWEFLWHDFWIICGSFMEYLGGKFYA